MAVRVIHADSSLQYYGYYLAGFAARFGSVPLSFGTHDLPALTSPQEGLAVELTNGQRLFVSAADRATINVDALAWCDAYGMVNLDADSMHVEGGHKLVALGPGFGIRWESRSWVTRYVARAALAGGRTFANPISRLQAAHRHWRDRVPLSAYTPSTSDPHTLFSQATYWTNHPDINDVRVDVFDALRANLGSMFEGGLVPNGPCNLDPEQVAPAVALPEFLRRTGRSVAAINLPGVHQCLGWKLGEYLALGKAIVSTPLTREMPGTCEPGEHIHVVDGDAESWPAAVHRIAGDHAYRRRLETNARVYFDQYVAPAAAVDRLLAHASEARR